MSNETATGSLAPTGLSDKAVSYIRTIVPVLWGSVVTWLASIIPAVTDFLATINVDLTDQTVVGLVTAGAIALWYVLWRAVEKKIPNWLTAFVLGSSKQPAYVGTPGAPVVIVDPLDESQTDHETVPDDGDPTAGE